MQVSDSSSRILAGLLEARTGQQLTMSRRWRIETALASLLRERGIATLDELITILVMGKEPSLSQRVVEALLNNETYFFRDRSPFDLLGATVLPRLAETRAASKRIRIWSAGCSTGQETYSLAMLFAENEARWAGWTIDIYACDVSSAVVEVARRGIYSQFQVQRGLSIGQTLRWFEETPDGWQVASRLRKAVRFGVRNILDPLSFPGTFDLILCRNVLLYFDAATRRRAFDRLAGSLAADGLLMLGAGESARSRTERFRSADRELAGLLELNSEPALTGNPLWGPGISR